MLLFMFQAHLKFRERKAEAIKPGVGVEVGVEVGGGRSDSQLLAGTHR